MKSIKKNNNGFSLIELIVTIAVIAIVIVPFLKSFFTSMEVNNDARKIQNATAVAQDVVEKFKAKTIDEMIAYYQEKGINAIETKSDPTLDKYNRTYSKYVFNDIPVAGADSEDFYLTVTLDSTPYSEISQEDDKKLAVNSMTSPQFSSLFGSDVVMLFKQYTNSDSTLESYFRGTGEMSEAELADISPKTVKKSTDVTITGSYDSSKETYKYDIHLSMTYTYKGTKSVIVTRDLEKTYQTPDNHAIYMILPVYDNNTKTEGHDSSDSYYSSDELNISYNYLGSDETKPELSMYLAEQKTQNTDGLSYSTYKSENISITNNATKKTLYGYKNKNNNFKVYTNIKKSTSDSGSTEEIQGLTYSENSDSTFLYEITVDVRYKSKDGDILTTFTSSKED